MRKERAPSIEKICVFGAGAVGGHVAAKLARAGPDVSLVARGPPYAAIRSGCLRFPLSLHPSYPADRSPSSRCVWFLSRYYIN